MNLYNIQDGEGHTFFGKTKNEAYESYCEICGRSCGAEPDELSPIECMELIDPDKDVSVKFDDAEFDYATVTLKASQWCDLYENAENYKSMAVLDGYYRLFGQTIPLNVIWSINTSPMLSSTLF